MTQARYLIMGGGTGGHIFPALAVANELKARGATVAWLGTEHGMEARIVASADIPLYPITIKGFRGKGLVQKLLAPFLLCRAVWQAITIIRQFKPSVVIGFGGFVAAPGGIASRLLGKPLVIHEQNSVAGSSNRLLAKMATKKLAGFPDALEGAMYIGNPVRTDITAVTHKFAINAAMPLRVLIMGGSLGAKAINDVVPLAIAAVEPSKRPQVWHQTGRDKKAPVTETYKEQQLTARVDEFIHDVAEAYAWADILICRAGALTVSEVAAAGVPAIFIPLPSAIDNHQYFNAKWLVDNHAGILLEQKELTAESLQSLLNDLSDHREKLKIMHQQLKKLALPNAANQVANQCEELSYVC